jgi:hypothetical protein
MLDTATLKVEALRQAWLGRHAARMLSAPEVRRFVQNLPLPPEDGVQGLRCGRGEEA